MYKILRKMTKILTRMNLIFSSCMLYNNVCFGAITDTTLVTGTQNLISDLTNWLLIIAPTITILLVGYYLLRKSASDEFDAKRWDTRIKVAIICCIGVVVMSGLINVLMSYYK